MGNLDEIVDLLEILADLEAQRAEVVAPLAEKMSALEQELARLTADLDEQISSVEKAIKRAVITHGESVRGGRLRAVYVKPRVSWDTQRLEGYAEAHPEIRAFRRVGEPGVRITVTEEA